MPHLLLDFSDFNKKHSLLFKLKEKRKKQTNNPHINKKPLNCVNPMHFYKHEL